MRPVALVAAALLGSCATAGVSTNPHPEPPERQYSRRVWQIQDGLPQNRVQSLAQTADGYLWVGTSGGLARFDGVRFVVFNRSNTPQLLDDSILALWAGMDGSLWIGTEGGGLVQFRDRQFRTYGRAEGLTNNFVRALHEDRKGVLWVGTDRGFFRLEGGRLSQLDNRDGMPVLSVLDLRDDTEGRLWAAATVGLFVVEKDRLRAHSLAAPRLEEAVQRLEAGSEGGLWTGGPGGLSRLKDGRATTLLSSARHNFQRMLEDSRGNLWVATLAHGLLRLNEEGLTRFESPAMLPINTVHTVLEDREQSIWAGTQDGLVRLSRRTVRILGQGDGLTEDNVMTVFEDQDGSAWIASMTGDFYRHKDGKAQAARLPVSGFGARTAFRDSRGDLWLGSYNQGAVRLSPAGTGTYNTTNGLRNNSIRQILEDRRGVIWIATGSGLSWWDGTALKTYYVGDGLAYGSVRVLALDRNGDLLVGTDGGGNRLRDGQFIQDPALKQVGSERILAILVDSDGCIWLGTRGGGLFRIKGDEVSRITARDGLLSDSIYQLLEGSDGRIWFSGPSGIFVAARAGLEAFAAGEAGSLAVVPYGIAEGLESTQMNGGFQPAGCLRSSGEIWFPSVRGVVRIDPQRPSMAVPSSVLIESMEIDGRSFPLTGEIRIPPGRGRLEVHYTACGLLAPERITFQYKLEGFDREWIQAGSRRTAYYTNLPPGSYRFRVARFDAAAPQAVSEAVIAFVWQPRFFETQWFYALCVLFVAACGYAGFRVYARQTRQRYNALLEERARLAREMHDTVIQGCVGVSTLLEAASSLPDGNGAKKEELLDHARLQVRCTLEEARQAVWDLRHVTSTAEMAGTLREYAQRLGEEGGVPVEAVIEGEPAGLAETAQRNILLVAREAMRNAVMHAAPRRVEVKVSFRGKDEVLLEVADDGCGFKPPAKGSEEPGHYGIAGMQERIAQLGGELEIHSAPGEGTRVVARIPRRVNSDSMKTDGRPHG